MELRLSDPPLGSQLYTPAGVAPGFATTTTAGATPISFFTTGAAGAFDYDGMTSACAGRRLCCAFAFAFFPEWRDAQCPTAR